MTRDESVYPDPERFFPERHLNEHGEINGPEDPILFGFGRRCVKASFPLLEPYSKPLSM